MFTHYRTLSSWSSGDRVKINPPGFRDLGQVCCAGEPLAIQVADTVHEAVRDLTRARAVAMIDLKEQRQQSLQFLLRHGRI
jgi:hypothetical protein